MVLNKEISVLKGNRGRVTSFKFTNDGKTMMVGARDGKVALYNTTDQYKLITLVQHKQLGFDEEDEVTAMDYIYVNATTSYLAIGSGKGNLKILNLADISVIYTQEQFIDSEISFIQYIKTSTGEQKLLTCNFDQNFNFYLLKHLDKPEKLKCKLDQTRCLFLDEIIEVKIFKPENEYALVCSNSDSLKLFEVATGCTELYQGHTDIILTLDICPNAQMCLSGAKDNTVRLWKYDLSQKVGKKLQCLAEFKGHDKNVTSVYFAPKKFNYFCSVAQDNTLKVWKPPTSQDFQEVTSAQMTIMAHQKYINCVRVSPNDKLIATSSQDKSIKLWCPQTL